MNRIELIMAFFGVDERQAKAIAAIDDGKDAGDVVELTEDELAEYLNDSDKGEEPEA
ncbi:MAG: hypothetical protein KGR26_05420 [Cyanobacteria bacterium REEB65]|nr:hypothetical protein [Cyanobacteria bacterium REEB65]